MSYFESSNHIKERGMISRVMIGVLTVLTTTISLSQSAATIAVGQTAPDFTLPYATKDSVARTPLTLSSVVGKHNIVLAFYPADWSGGCTKEMCTMRDDFKDLEKLNAELLAVSGDYVFAHHEWAKQQNFPFRLLSDHLHTVARLYDSYTDKSYFNKRTVFILNKQGKIAYEDLEYSVADRDDFNRLKDALAKLQ
jgi:glutaredoxin-dependent peroxiredoxin